MRPPFAPPREPKDSHLGGRTSIHLVGVVQVCAWGVWRQLNPMPMNPQDCWKRPTEAQMKAAKRALHSFVRKFPQYGVVSGRGGRGGLYLYERGDKLSAMWAKLNSQTSRYVNLDNARSALAHAEARCNEPFKLKDKRPIKYFMKKDGSLTPTHLTAPRTFNLDLPDAALVEPS
ncbi:MAG TPA: hypothetical protein VFE60_12000 [Roseiarcus sp.]|jgi:hypothetical protein|nr:hypothetical protein [Roseiarcus sp.]